MKICTKAKESVQEFAWRTDLPLPVRVSVVIFNDMTNSFDIPKMESGN